MDHNIFVFRKPVQCADQFQAPEFVDEASICSNISMKAGGNLNVPVAFSGKPEPTITWSKLDTKASRFLLHHLACYKGYV